MAQTSRSKESDWTKSTFNFAGLHFSVGAQYTVRTSGHRDRGRVVAPQIRDFAGLILDYPALGLDQAITLSVHEVSTDELGQLVSLVLEARPFERYRIWVALSLAPASRVLLAKEIERLKDLRLDPRGLLITICVARTVAGPAIQLATESSGPTTFDFPELVCPFDHRNLVWRDRFSGQVKALTRNDTAEVALRSVPGEQITRRRYSISIPAPPGLPKWAAVALDEPCYEKTAFLDLIPEAWDPWEAETFGVVVQESSLYLPHDHGDRAAAIRSLEALRPGHVITMREVSRSIRNDGRVYAFSNTNLQILLNAETISLALPCDPKRSWRPGRSAVLNHFEWRPSDFRILVRLEDVPAAAVSHGRAKAIITRLPPIHAKQIGCGVAWLDAEGSGITEATLVLEFTTTGRRLPTGTMLEIMLIDGRAQARLLEPFGIADLIWFQDPELGPDSAVPDGSLVGTLQHRGATWDVHEIGGGHFALRQSKDATAGARAALRRQFGLPSGQDDIAAIDLARDRPRDRIWGASGRRSALDCGGGVVATGTTASEVIGGALRLSGLQLSMRSAPEAGGWLIERHFQILRDRHRPALSGQAVRSESFEPEDEDPLIAMGDVVSGRFEPRTSTLVVSGELRRSYPNGVHIAPDVIQRAPLLPGVHYPGRRASAMIISMDPLQGSFVAAPECSLEHLALDLQAARTDDESLNIDPGELRLVFVGREEAPADGSSGTAGRYIFEWGYGRWLGLEAEQVRYDGGPIQNAKLLLFYGDRISAGDVTEEGLLIESIAPSRGHVLYRHSRDHRVVNLLRVIAGRDGEPTIDAITGFDPEMERQTVGGALPHARLDPEGVRRVGLRLAEKPVQRMLGRLDTKRFEESWGRTLLFNFRRLDLNDGHLGLTPGDRVFVTAGSIQRTRNDVGLTIRNPGLHPDDADPSFVSGNESRQLMLRRAFSIRQQALGSILELEGTDKLNDSILLVRLERRGLSLVEGALLRNPQIVRQRLTRGKEVVGVFGGRGVGTDWTFELSPGVMVGLPQAELLRTAEFYRGDVVAMRATDDGRISLALVWPSDLRFVREGRPAVLLPRDTLGRRDAFPPYADPRTRRLALNAFSVGDLPDLNVSARARQPDGRIGEIADEEFVSFMCRPHPKIGELHFNDQDNPERDIYFTPDVGTQTIVGQLVCENRNAGRAPHVRVVEFGNEATEYPSDWHLLSYADVPAAKLVWPATKGEKQFHDRQTTIWKRTTNDELEASSMRIPPMTAHTGPLFFTVRTDGVATLRRPAAELARFATGPAALLPLLSRTQSERRPIQVTVAEAGNDYLLVEHYPGQFLQIAAGMLQFRTLGDRLSMRAFDYSLFAAGDRLTLTADEQADSLTLVALDASWTHGPRNAFGPRGALLERDEVASNPTEGVALYGTGKLMVGLPTQDADALPLLAIVGGEHSLGEAPQDPRNLLNCTVLLVEGPDEKVRIQGLPQANFAPSQDWSWDDDFLFRGAVRGAGRSMKFHREELLIRLRLAGGALPFTVERCGREGPVFLALSRRHQEIKPIGQKIMLALVEGQIGSTRLVQLRVGGRHLALPTTALLPGVRPVDERAVFAALGEARRSVWLRSHDEHLVSGYGVEKSGSLTVAPRKVVRQEQRFLGVVCEGISDGRLYWLAADDAAAFTYSADEAEKVFSSSQMRRLKVALLSSGAVSVMQHPASIAEVDRLRLGASIFVDCTDVDLQIPAWAASHTTSGWKLRVCVSKQTSITLALAADSRHFERRSLQAEVAVRRDGRRRPLILLAAANERIVASEAPSWLFAVTPPPWAGTETRFLAPSSPIDGLVGVVEALEGRGELATAVELIAKTRAFVSTEWVGVLSGVALCAGLKARDPRGANPVREARVKLLRNLFGRSLRSAPLEPLAMWILRPPTEVSAFTAIRRRQLLELFRGGRLDAARVAAERWLSAIDLEGVKPEEEAVANAFGVLIGRVGRADILLREARFLSSIISATRAIGVAAEVMDEAMDSATERLMQVAADLRDRRLDIPLLPPLQLFD